MGTKQKQNKNVRTIPANCAKRGCEGVLFDVTPAIAARLGQKHVQCDRCKQRTAYTIANPHIGD